MEEAPDLRDLILRVYDAMNAQDVAFIESIISRADSSLQIGTDPREWWAGYDAIVDAFGAQLKEMGDVRLRAGHVRAYREGTVGWIDDRPAFVLGNGTEVPIRVTAVFTQERGAWKWIQGHASIGVPNEEAIGRELTV